MVNTKKIFNSRKSNYLLKGIYEENIPTIKIPSKNMYRTFSSEFIDNYIALA